MNKLYFLKIGSGYHKSEKNTSAYIKNNDSIFRVRKYNISWRLS
jgi:hypothetical protein